jgi:hypothetical protein
MNADFLLNLASLYRQAVTNSSEDEISTVTEDGTLFDEAGSLYSEAGSPRGEYMRQYMAQRYHKKRQEAISALGGKCVRCGSKSGPFHLDHVNKRKKTMRAADIHSVNDKRVKKEMKNLQILCDKCHREKTKEAWDFSTPKPRHGTYWMYRKHKCRCGKCTAAYKQTLKDWRNKSKAK